ncbi:hypothetical protein [Rhodobacter capsulatus]|uniref:hypothetical protein n=1 Tax=Rhodobacter capsulatus TaxID=1061 RepID=UPI0003D34972|nr:hypothetical protein [Rhodobacter capsulatus]ETD01848.1 hypothetical protein U714_10465 [Rhodobacter capsulatus DE442]ETD76906.1 hypothetical protein U717_10620 [Rhodobacter capsulatus R121]ETE53742.1 hypothetical protein U715_10620 [Rhodobacter capsulatus Y262]
MQIKPNSVLIAGEGASVEYVAASGEILGRCPLKVGRNPARPLLALAPEGATLSAVGEVFVAEPRSAVWVEPVSPFLQTGANPDFQPSSADLQERKMRAMLARLQAKENRLEARMAALQSIERVPSAPQADPPSGDPAPSSETPAT